MTLTEKQLFDALELLLADYIAIEGPRVTVSNVPVAKARAALAAATTNHVSPGDGCPSCGERDSDELVWDNHEIHCQKCGQRYKL